MDKRFAAILVGIMVILGGVFWFTRDKSSTKGNNIVNSAKLSNHTIGANLKKVNLTEYGDFQCSACYSWEQLVRQIREKYQNDIALQFRHYPIKDRHPNAFAASRAAEAAAIQGKFWEMHDKLYETQDPTGASGWVASKTPLESYFIDFAKGLSLDIDKFRQDFASSEVNAIINADFNEGQRLGVTGTPTFFLQGKKLDPAPQDVDGFSKAINQAIKDANQ